MNLVTESGNKLISESVAGFTGVSTLNDTLVRLIEEENFTTNPALSGWLIGSAWAWDSVNHYMEPV